MEDENGDNGHKLREFAGAAAVGINQTLIGLPFDTTKVWLQNGRSIYGQPVKTFYRGALPELSASMLANGLVFPFHTFSLPYTNNSFISGGLAGACISPLVYSFRSYKIYQQMGYKLSWDLLLRNRGRGLFTAMCRESLGYAMYFGSYSILRDNDIPIFVSGALAGLCNWGTSYPIDTILSRQIAQKTSISGAFHFGSLYKGYGVCLLRSMIVNGCSFLVYETVKSIFNDDV